MIISCFFFLAESVIEDMVGPDWKKRWMYWIGRTKEQVKRRGTGEEYKEKKKVKVKIERKKK